MSKNTRMDQMENKYIGKKVKVNHLKKVDLREYIWFEVLTQNDSNR